MSEAVGVSSGVQGLPLIFKSLCCGLWPHEKLSRRLSYLLLRLLCAEGQCLGSVGVPIDVGVYYVTMGTFDVVNLLFVVVCGCGPMINLSCKPSNFFAARMMCWGHV